MDRFPINLLIAPTLTIIASAREILVLRERWAGCLLSQVLRSTLPNQGEYILKFIVVFLTFLFLIPAPASLAQGTRKSRANTTRGRKTKPVKPASETASKSPVTTTPSGLIFIITKRSEGRQPRVGETVVVNYTGLLTDGNKFDSSLDRGQPFKFKLGEGRVIKGWDEGIAKLRVGEQATLIIPPQLGYGAKGAGGVIPPEATLVFIVELMGIEELAPTN